MTNCWENAKKMMMNSCWDNLTKVYVRRKVYKQLKYSKKSKLPKDWRFLNHNVLVCLDKKQELFKNFRKRTRKRLIRKVKDYE